MDSTAYRKPGFVNARVANPLLAALVRLGFSIRGAHILAVRGRQSGEWRSTPVNPLTVAGTRYIVAPRGETHWVRNLRAAGAAELRVGRTAETIRVEEMQDESKPPLLRAYLERWYPETGKLFGVSRQPTDEDLRRVAPRHPVFRIL